MKRTIFSYFTRLDPASEPTEPEKKRKEQSMEDLTPEKLVSDSVSTSNGAMVPDNQQILKNSSTILQDDILLFPKNDIGVIADTHRSPKNAIEILKVIDETWLPTATFKFPKSGVKNLSFQTKWLEEFSWLSYSAKNDGGYCKYCIAFGVKSAGVVDAKLGKLVNKRFNVWKHAKETFRNHEKNEYHRKSILGIENLRDVELGKRKAIDLQLDQQKEKARKENYERLKHIVKTIVLCGRQGNALRGHRDDGPLFQEWPNANNEADERENFHEGNFRAILKYRAESDEIFKENLLSMPKNATYLSKTTQNEIIEICHKLIRGKIVDKVNISKGFSVLADESTDISSIEQFSICIRCLDSKSNICEDFLGFVPVTNVSGRGLADSIRNYLYDVGVDCSYMYGQGYDGAPAMSGQFNGTQAHLRS
ncbi:zinc finger MYM-type protein 1-like [Eurosta solidaginis]|uniref:zinc finger MYM-type protein 1-like n=1 Tax=Eurosta solidaginis TaxID=178769 RepID=UPI0035307122